MRRITRLALSTFLVMGLGTAVAGPAAAAAPSNDDFDNATVIGSLPYTSDPIDTTDATDEASDPACVASGSTVWFDFTPTTTGFVAFDTFQSDYDTVLAAYTGTQGSLTEVDCNDDDSGTAQSRIIFEATQGTTYHIMAGGFFGNTGTLVLHGDVSEPPFTFEVAFSSKGSVRPKTGEVTIRGTVVCSEPGFLNDVDGELRQRVGRTLVRGFFFFQSDCSEDPTPFSVTVTSDNGLFVAGRATIRDVFAEGCGATDCDAEFFSGVVTTVKLGR